MSEEELFKINFPEYVTEKGMCLSPYWDLFSAGIECATFELNNGCIQTLTKENAELKEKLNFGAQYYQGEKVKKQLIKAKEIIKRQMKIIDDIQDAFILGDFARETIKEAEDFIKE